LQVVRTMGIIKISMELPVIDVKNLVKRYGDKTVVAGITFSVAEGEGFELSDRKAGQRFSGFRYDLPTTFTSSSPRR